jgi:hypothetical protein
MEAEAQVNIDDVVGSIQVEVVISPEPPSDRRVGCLYGDMPGGDVLGGRA